MFGLCVLHSVLILRQQYGTRALSGYYPFSMSDVFNGIDLVTGKAFTLQQDGKTIVDGARLSQVECDWTNDRSQWLVDWIWGQYSGPIVAIAQKRVFASLFISKL